MAFHFNPRNDGDYVVRNTRVDGSWQHEEREAPYFPFNQGMKFVIKIEVAQDRFRVHVNGRHFIDYEHRMDLGRINYLYLSSGAEYYDVTFQNKHVSYLIEISQVVVSICTKTFFLAWVAKPEAIVIIPKINPCQIIYEKKRVKVPLRYKKDPLK